MVIFIASVLVIAGIAATGFLANEIGELLQAQGANQAFDTKDDVVQALLRIGRPDKAQQFLESTGSGLNEFLGNTTNLILVGGAALLLFKPKFLKGL